MNNHLKTGGDPRALSDYAVLRDELAKLSHPARPDVDWQSVEKLSLSLFRQNGIELQTLAWYTLARTRIAGMAGLNEGLAIMEALVANQWGALWPQPVHARMEILSGFSQRLQSVLRTLTLGYADLQQVYEAERHLNALRDVLERLELKNASQINELCNFMHNATTRLENMSDNQNDGPAVVLPATVARPDPLIYVAREEQPEPNIVTLTHEPSFRPWKAFLAGVMTMLVVGGAGLWGWQHVGPQPATPVPVSSDESSLTALSQLPPLWRQEYGFVLASRAEPVEADKLKTQWQQYINGNALPPEALGGWHQGMDGLQALTRRLNALDERKGKYLTGSELKSMVFTIMQDFGRSVPVEEQLYQLSLDNSGEALAPSLLMQTDMYMNQLLNRYMLIRQQKNGL